MIIIPAKFFVHLDGEFDECWVEPPYGWSACPYDGEVWMNSQELIELMAETPLTADQRIELDVGVETANLVLNFR